MADWNGPALRRWLCSADRLSEAAIFLASSDSKTWSSRSSASLRPVTSAEHLSGNVLIGRAIDRMGYWVPALLSSIALSAGLLLAALSTSILQFTLAQGLLIGIGTSVIFGPLIADISHWFNRRRGVAVTAAAAGNYLAGALWPTVMPTLMKAEGWRFTYAAIGIFCLVT